MNKLSKCFLGVFFFALFSFVSALPALAAWNDDWTSQQKISINAGDLKESLSQVPVLVRLHSGNFDFTSANLDGSDLRFIAADDKTELKFYVEKYDSANELAVIWVMLPQLVAGAKDTYITLYTGNESAPSVSNISAINDPAILARFSFAEAGLLKDSSANQLTASGNVVLQKAGLVAESATLSGTAPISVTLSEVPALQNGLTLSAWIKPASLPQTSTVFSLGNVAVRLEGAMLQLDVAGAKVATAEIKASTWQHIALVMQADKALLLVNGAQVGESPLAGAVLDTTFNIGASLLGDVDQLEVSKAARNLSWLSFVAKTQGAEATLVKVELGEAGEEEEGEANYMGILIDSLTIDAKVVIAILAVMFAISVWVMYSKAVLVTKADKDNDLFMKRFQKASTQELLSLDKGASFANSPLYGLYLAGLREIKKREVDGKVSLGGASIDAIKAAVDADLVRETQRMNALMVLLTIAISGGPFLGLLGTVVGVMITFAAIAAAGDVNVNAIAPGIAAALLATVAGLGVAIPALFGYNYLASRIKNITISMQIFVDEFVTRVAELYGKD